MNFSNGGLKDRPLSNHFSASGITFGFSIHVQSSGARRPSGRASDSGASGRGLDTYLRRVVSLSKDTFTPRKVLVVPRKHIHVQSWGARWPSGRASDSGASGRGFDTYLRRVVSLSKDTFTPRKVLVVPRKRWLRLDMAEKLFTGTLSHNKTKMLNHFFLIVDERRQLIVCTKKHLISSSNNGFHTSSIIDTKDCTVQRRGIII